jgi:hypothetical protein
MGRKSNAAMRARPYEIWEWCKRGDQRIQIERLH